MNTQDDFTELLLKHNYIVKCVADNNSVSCAYDKLFNVVYTPVRINDNIYELHIAYSENDKCLTEKLLLQSYIVRWYIFLDVVRLCRINGLSYNIIRFFNMDGVNKDLNELLDILSTEEIQLESSMHESISEILKDVSKINSFDNYYKKIGNFYTFNILKGLLV